MEISQKTKLIQVISIFCQETTICLFGSWARGTIGSSSDIDITIDKKHEISFLEMNQMRHMIDVLNTPRQVDLVDFNRVPIAMQENIIRPLLKLD